MIALLQRVSRAEVLVAGARVAAIDAGLLVFIGIERPDTEGQADRLLERLLGYRVFPDPEGRMNLSLTQAGGGLLLVPQFTLAADTTKGLRPSFTPAAGPEQGRLLFRHVVARAQACHPRVQSGIFGAEMQVALVNEGPVTFWLRVPGPG